MTITSDTFVAIIPSTEEEMLAIANSVIRLNNSREYYLSTIEAFQQLAGVMQEHLAHLDCKKKCPPFKVEFNDQSYPFDELGDAITFCLNNSIDPDKRILYAK